MSDRKTGIKRKLEEINAQGANVKVKKLKQAANALDAIDTQKKWYEKDEICSDDDDGTKWSSLEHHGPIFNPRYEPHGVKVLYKGEPATLEASIEEACTYWAQVCGTDWEHKEAFRKNFSKELMGMVGRDHTIKSLDDCDFSAIVSHLQELKEKKKNRSDVEKKKEKEEKKTIEANFGTAFIDNTIERIQTYLVEPPGLFRGRGEHPRMGYLKSRIMPEDYTINVGLDNCVPKCPMPGHAWKEIVHNNKVTWLGYYKDEKNGGSNKYIYLSADSKWKGQNDMKKYEKARKLRDNIESIRKDYIGKMNHKEEFKRQLGTATYLIDFLALRVGNEKSEETADTVGCCSLRVEHLSFGDDNQVTFDFLGKDSMRYLNTVTLRPEAYTNIKNMTNGKEKKNDLFHLISTSNLNEYLRSFMEGLTAKVFRTYNASKNKFVYSESLTVDEKVKFYTEANKQVAILCNHQKAASKNFDVQVEKMQSKIDVKKEKLKLLQDNLKVLKGKKKSKVDLKNVSEEAAKIKLPTTTDKTMTAIKKLQETIAADEQKLQMKEDTKTVALGTSKINYMDPRITIAWCKNNEVPIEKIFSKTLRKKFPWAMSVKLDWQF
eukprot:CAMPEP_0114998046 /NCGR_PEP_ID=MMETSP0216-20121206/15264_1 /TAXON_ID=223996 /ORGANISM="Protocruzia adherens, Strain Boccale" /LENGTH=603 /DNA_ID=CAMNT_0002362549 /DNA_START=157 /DNA_END=1969 /DNA_ORIENTATION=+